MSAAKPKNAWLWGCKELSDVELHLLSPQTQQQPDAKEDSNSAQRFALHAVVLAANSLHFRSRLLNQGCHISGNLRVLDEQVASAEELQAACIVLKHMYKEALEYDCTSHLVTAMKLADQWQAEDTVAACSATFAGLRQQDINTDTIQRAFSLQGHVHNAACFQHLLARVTARLLEAFSDLVQVMRNPSLQAQLLQLPFNALAILLNSDQLVVDSENTVLAVANLWVMRGPGGITAEQKDMLASCVRLQSLSASYLCGVLPNLKWFTWPTEAPAAYYTALQARMISKDAGQMLLAHSRPGGAGANNSHHKRAGAAALASGRPVHVAPAGHATVPSTSGNGVAEGSDAQGTTPMPAIIQQAGGFSGSGHHQAPLRRMHDHNLELVCDIDEDRLTQYINDGMALHAAHAQGGNFFKGIHVHSECSYFNGFLWGIKVVFGFSSGSGQLSSQSSQGSTAENNNARAKAGDANSASSEGRSQSRKSSESGNGNLGATAGLPQFTVTPSVFAALPPGEEGISPLHAPINTTFRCTLEAIGNFNTPYSAATFLGASFMKPGDENVSSIGISNFFKKLGAAQGDPAAWKPFLHGGNKLRLKLQVAGESVE